MNIVVYCSSCDTLPDQYLQIAAAVGQWIGRHGHTLVYGGVKAGLMHVTAVATHQAGGRCVGVIPEMFRHRLDTLCDEVILTTDLADRKQRMIGMGDVFVVLPGGIGTLDEWVSTLTVLCVGDDDPRPIIVADLDGMFEPTVRQLADLEKTPFARGKHLSRTLVATTAAQLLATLDDLAENRPDHPCLR